MAKTYGEVINELNNLRSTYFNLSRNSTDVSQIVCAQGRYMRQLRATIKWCDKNGHSSNVFRDNLRVEFGLRNRYLQRENRQNRKGNYNMIVRMGKGFKNIANTFTNGVEQTIKAADATQRKEGAKQIGTGILRGVGHVAKSSLSLVTGLISTKGVIGLLMLPAHIVGIGIHVALHLHEKTPIPKYEGKPIKRVGNFLVDKFKDLHNVVERL